MAEFEKLIQRLSEYQVKFVIVGGYAAVIQGSALMTRDIDVSISLETQNILLLQDALKDLHPYHRMTPQKIPLDLDEIKASSIKNLYLQTDWGQIDCLGEVKGLGSFEDVEKHSEPINFEKFACKILDLSGLIIAKKAMNRPKDQHVVIELEAIQKRLKSNP